MKTRTMVILYLLIQGALLLLAAAAYASPPKMGRTQPVPRAQSDFILNELKHMGWRCDWGVLSDWTCTSRDGLYHIYGIKEPGK